MAIRNKDGTVYTLRGPNPLNKNMAEWDKSQITLINLKWSPETVVDDKNPIKEAKEKIVDIGEVLELPSKFVPAKEFIADIKEEPKQVVVPKIEEPKQVVLDVDPKTAKLLKERGVVYFCAPVTGHNTHTDDLYGDTYTTPEYGDQFKFDAILIEEEPYSLQIWCIRDLAIGSIIYRKTSRADADACWWKIRATIPKTGGYLCEAEISSVNPDFS
jgi:hypothetical protein